MKRQSKKALCITSNHKGAYVLAAQLAHCGLTDVVISPGSRNAPLIIAFDAQHGINTHVVIDERSAAHVALGLSLRSGVPAAVVCTSGTAVLNHGPAIAEAFHHKIPLLSITADRPKEVIGKGHGQSIIQEGVFSTNCLGSFVIDEKTMTAEEIASLAAEAYNTSCTGPIHINVPFEEPLYGTMFGGDFPLVELVDGSGYKSKLHIPNMLQKKNLRALIIGGSLPFNRRPKQEVSIAGVCEVFSGIEGEAIIHSSDMIANSLNGKWKESLKPEVIITIGTPTMSKAFRKLITEIGAPHIHVSSDGKGWDTFNQLKECVKADPKDWLYFFHKNASMDTEFIQSWKNAKLEMALKVKNHPDIWSDFLAFKTLFEKTPKNSTIHLSNSTSARYAQLFSNRSDLKTHSNRGVAGIDGCTSTAVGDALKVPSCEFVTLITGDIAFLYDINGLISVQNLPTNLRVVVINNGGGEIFRWIDGAEESGLLDAYFETKPKSTIKSAASYCGLPYFCATDVESAILEIKNLYDSEGPSILELKTDGKLSNYIYKSLLSKKA